MTELRQVLTKIVSAALPAESFKTAINATGLIAPDVIVKGRIMPFAGLNKPPHNKAARYFMFPDGKV